MRLLFFFCLILFSLQSAMAVSPVLTSPKNDSLDIPTRVRFEWKHIAGADFYDIEVDTSPLFNSTFYVLINGTTDYSSTMGDVVVGDSISDLHYGTKYYWKVKPRNLSGGTFSETRSFTTIYKPRIFGPLNGATAVPLTGDLTFYHDLGNNYYHAEVSATPVFTSPIYYQTSMNMMLLPHNVQITFNNVTGLAYNTDYYWRGKIYNAKDSSEWSDTIHFTTEVDPNGIIENSNLHLNFYPNPANDYLQINNIETGSTLIISNIKGENVYMATTKDYNEKILLSNFAEGMYILKIQTTNNGISTHKLIITR